MQCLEHTLGVSVATVRVLDGLRKQCNLTDYDGELVTQAAWQECLHQAKVLLQIAQAAIKAHPVAAK